MSQKIIHIVLVFAVLGFLFFFLPKGGPAPTDHKLQVSASFYPLAFFAEQIGGNKADVFNITPAGAEPHDYEPSAQDIARITGSKILILNGEGLEPWANNVRKNLDPQNTTVVVSGDGFNAINLNKNGQTMLDPHFWLSPTLAKTMVDKIALAFEQADIANASYYETNAAALRSRLDRLNQEYSSGLAHCAEKNIITSHTAFGYLAQDYGLIQVSIAGLSPDAEPSSKQLAQVANFAKKNNVNYIFFESLVSPKLSQTIASEIGAQTLVLNPIEGMTKNDISAGKDYFTEMENNLSNLQTALQCIQ